MSTFHHISARVLYSDSERLGMMSFGVKRLRRKLATTSRQQVDEIPAQFLPVLSVAFQLFLSPP